jgi:hypothetical protein
MSFFTLNRFSKLQTRARQSYASFIPYQSLLLHSFVNQRCSSEIPAIVSSQTALKPDVVHTLTLTGQEKAQRTRPGKIRRSQKPCTHHSLIPRYNRHMEHQECLPLADRMHSHQSPPAHKYLQLCKHYCHCMDHHLLGSPCRRKNPHSLRQHRYHPSCTLGNRCRDCQSLEFHGKRSP